MNTIMKSSNGINLIPIDTRLLSQRKVYIDGVITAESACAFDKAIRFLITEDAAAPIDIYVSSPGGEVNAGMHIYDLLKLLPCEVNLHCRGIAASMAASIVASGKKGHRFILPHSKMMIHEPLIDGGIGGSATSIQRTAESIMETKRILVSCLARDTGRSESEVEAASAYDNYMNAEQAIAFGLCDSIDTSI